MFYYPNVLHYRTGCFATIWLAATKGRKISRRDLLKVNVQVTCDDIIDYVLVRVAPLSAGLPRPRFSLYLSSQLQYGVVLIFHRQCQLLLDEIQEAIDRLLRFRTQVQIDMLPEDVRQPLTIPDALTLLNETEGARDPFFGLMDFGFPSPSSLIQLAQQIGEISTERLLPERRVTPPSDGITASQESITLPEREPEIMPGPEFEGAELQDFDMIGMLLEQPDDFLEGEEGRAREADLERQRERDRERQQKRERERGREEAIQRERERAAAETERIRELTRSTISLEQIQTAELSSRDVVFEAEEALGLPGEMPVLVERETTPIPEPLLIPPSPPSPAVRRERRRERPRLEPVPISPEAPVERRRRRRRQLAFIDEHTQIPQEALRAQINDPRTQTRPLADVLVKAPSEESDPKTLLSNPCMSLPPEILELWKQGAVIRPIPPTPRREEVREEEAAPERERGREEPEEREAEREIIFKEVPREMAESSISQYDTPVSSLVILETTEREASPLETPETRRSPVPVSIYGLEDIAEERIPDLEDITMDIEHPLGQAVPFHSLLPPKISRRTVAQAFWRLLEQIDAKEVTVRQDEPYGDIFITQLQQIERRVE
ncbi:REC8 meiotic recombination protein b [Salminus brasiliensis]|uniref:REC8 meiotic recombination protein b n=1 Tax=Salminus brasiliensis TaxID=930266 RepID=UPI003B833924